MIISYRIGMDNFDTEARLEETCAFLGRHTVGVDEISLFTEGAHGYHPIEFLRGRLPMFERALERFRDMGWRCGINLLNTMGHLDEAPERLWETPFQKMIGHDGTLALASSCPLDPAFLEDVRQRYRMYAELGPDFLWVDDDLRINHHPPVHYGCYCPLCLADIGARLRREFTRETLVEELRRDTWPEPNGVQSAWDQRNHEAIMGVLHACERGAHEVAPGLELGLMTGMAERVDEWLEVLAGADNAPVRFRPGAGFYIDDVPGGAFEKALRIGLITANSRPERLSSIQCEIENFPYHKLQKSVQLNMVEAACYQATGCRGIAWNILPDAPNPFDDYEARLGAIERWRPFFEVLAEWGGDLPATGLWLATSLDYYPGGYFGGFYGSTYKDPTGRARQTLRELGLPQAFRREPSCVTVLAGGAISALSALEVSGSSPAA